MLYRTYDYSSNPKLNDTDFDGIDDNVDNKPIDNKLKGTTTEIGNIEYNQDFRWFLTDNKKYNDELAVMSLMMCNLANGGDLTINQLNFQNHMEVYMKYLGFKEIKNKKNVKIDNKTFLNANIYTGNKEIDYYGNKKTVYGIFIGNLDYEKAYRKLLVNTKNEEIKKYYENIAMDIISYINEIQVDREKEICYWVSGKGLSGGVANIVAKNLIDNRKKIYCYTFGAPQNNLYGSGVYSAIKNIINEDDIIPKLLNTNNNFYRYGEKYNGSVKYDYIRKYIDLFKTSDYRGDYKTTNKIVDEYKDIRKTLEADYFYDRLSKYLHKGSKMEQNEFANTQIIGSQLDKYKKDIMDAKGIKAYYTLSKNFDGFDIAYMKDEYDEMYIFPDSSETIVSAKDLVIGKGTYERPYYSENQELIFNTTETEFWCKFIVDGATDIQYIIPENYVAKVYAKTIGDYRVIRELKGKGKDIIYKLSDINNYENVYFVKFECLKTNVLSNHIEMKFVQHYDIREFEDYIYRWERDEEGVIVRDDIFKYKTYCSKELAPTLVNLELNTSEEIIEKYINGVIKGKGYYDLVKSTTKVVLAGIAGFSSGGILFACRAMGVSVIREIIDYDHLGWSVFSKILPNRYTTNDYKNDLKRASGYHLENISAYVNDIQDLAICDYSIAIYERYLNPLTGIGIVGIKGCERWEDDMVYGIPGVVGRWNSEIY